MKLSIKLGASQKSRGHDPLRSPLRIATDEALVQAKDNFGIWKNKHRSMPKKGVTQAQKWNKKYMRKTKMLPVIFVGCLYKRHAVLCRCVWNRRQGCSGAGTRGNGVPAPFSRFSLKWVGSCFKMAILLMRSHTFFVSTTSLIEGHDVRTWKFVYLRKIFGFLLDIMIA